MDGFSLPTGAVSFLLSDVEASTRLLRSDPDGYERLMDLHHSLLRRVWSRHGGVELGTEGDSFLVAFAHAEDAVAAAADVQRAVHGASWPTDLPVRVRVGVHTGYAQPHGGEYRALAVHQTARVAAAAHGGQVLLTDETFRRLSRLPDAAHSRLLGRFRVRDFEEPVRLHRLDVEGVPVVDTAPRVRPADGHNIVAPRTSLVGRDDDVVSVTGMVEPGAVVTVLGPGGVGKTRLALEVGLRVAPQWPDGVWFVDLSPVSSPLVVPSAVAAAVGAPSLPGADAAELVRDYLQDRRAVLLLDNCEHLLQAVGTLVTDLTEHSPGLAVLATSRVPLGLRAERTYRLGPLTRTAGGDPGVDLLRQRSSGSVQDADLAELRTLVETLDGLPLAIELAAARTTSLSPREILDQIRVTPSLLSSRDPTLPERQRSMDRLLDWSVRLLDDATTTVLHQLCTFSGGFDLDTAEALCAGVGVPAVATTESLWTLLDHSLLVREVAAGTTRFRVPSTVLSYMRSQVPATELASARGRLARIYAEQLGPGAGDDRVWAGRVALEADNIRHVARQLDGSPDEEVAQQLAWSLARLHDIRNAFREGITETAAWLRHLTAPTPSRVGLLTMLADLHLRIAELDEAEAVLAEALSLAEAVGLPEWDDAGLTRSQGEIALRRGDHDEAGRRARAAMAGATSPRGRARLWNLLGISQVLSGDPSSAVQSFAEELDLAATARVDSFTATIHGNLAEVHLQLGDLAEAARHQRTCLSLARSEEQPLLVAFSMMVAARIALQLGWPADRAVVLQTVADRMLEELTYALYDEDAAGRDALVEATRRELGAAAFARAVAEGGDMSVDDAADLAEAVLEQASRLSRSPASAAVPPSPTGGVR